MKTKVFFDGFDGHVRRSLDRARRREKGERLEAEGHHIRRSTPDYLMPHGPAHPALPGSAEETAEYFSTGRRTGPQSRLGDQGCEQAQEAWPAAPARRGQSRTWGGADRRARRAEVRDAHRLIEYRFKDIDDH
jgi:hypothetical protein